MSARRPRARAGWWQSSGRAPRRPLLGSTVAVLLASVLAAGPLAGAAAASASARPATPSERVAILRAFKASDGSTATVHSVYVSRSNPRLSVVCERTPEAGFQAYVFSRTGSSWRYVVGGAVGRAGNSADRQLERAC